MENFQLNATDRRLIEKLTEFIPDKIFDAHAHLYEADFLPNMYDPAGNIFCQPRLDLADYSLYQAPLYGREKTIRLNIVTTPDAAMAERENGLRAKSVLYLARLLAENPDHVGEVFVLPDDTAADLAKLLVHPRIKGFKCYHLVAARKPTWQAHIKEFLPESAWQVAHELGLCLTLHMVRDKALADQANLAYIKLMATRFPQAKLILAHAARGFAAWTTIESVAELAGFANVYFDLSAVCEPAPILAILKHCGSGRVLWGSDFPVSMARGKALSLGEGFLWLYQQELQALTTLDPLQPTLVGLENLLAVQQAAQLADLTRSAVADIFYNNAAAVFA